MSSHSSDQSSTDSWQQLEKKHVFEVYDSIASHFSQTRHKPWPRVSNFLLSLSQGSLVYDVGCGNAKYYSVNPSLVMVGCDSSSNLLSICKNRGMDCTVAEVQALPFRSNSADHFICIAVLHHLSSESRRVSSLIELTRVLKVGGTGLIYVWAFEQSKGGNNSNYTSKSCTCLVNEDDDSSKHSLEHGVNTAEASNCSNCYEREENKCSIDLPIHQNRTPFRQQDMLVPWKLAGSDGSCFLRYYHVFRENELVSLCIKVPGLSVIESYYDDGNWCVRVEKTC